MKVNVFQAAVRGLAALSIVLFAGSAQAASVHGRMVVFGDSLVDTGNTSIASGGAVPGPAYFDGRFSNGPVWPEHLAQDLDLPTPLPSARGGSNYAFGGSQSQDAPGPDPRINFVDLNEQVDAYLDDRQAARPSGSSPDNSLYVVQSGANDFLIGGQTDPSVPAANVAMSIERLHEQGGAKNVLAANLPDLGRVPAVNDQPKAAAALSALSTAYNRQLDARLTRLEQDHPDLNLIRLDVGTGLEQILRTPGEFGLTNVTDAAAKDLDLLQGDTTPSRIVDNPENYLFWDSIHASATGHALIGDLAIEAVGDLHLTPSTIPTPTAASLILSSAGLTLLSRPYRLRRGGKRGRGAKGTRGQGAEGSSHGNA